MLKVSDHVMSSDTGCMGCLATVAPTLGANLLLWVFLISLFAET